MMQQIQMQCENCGGAGETFDEKNKCKTCNGRKVIPERKILEVHIDKGMEDEQKIVFSGESNEEPGVPAGDIIVVLDEKEHPEFKRQGMDLILEMEIQLVEALCGFKRVVKHLDDRKLLISSPPGCIIKDGDIRIVKNEGMPKYRDPYEKGRLFIKFKVVFPPAGFGSPEALAALEKLLPPRPQPMEEADVEEHTLDDFDPEAYSRESQQRQRGQAYDEDASGGHAHHGHGPGMQCANQ